MEELLGNTTSALVHSQKLIKADYQGAILSGEFPVPSLIMTCESYELYWMCVLKQNGVTYINGKFKWSKVSPQAILVPPVLWSRKAKAC